MMRKILFVALIIIPLNLFGVLPPLYTSIDQIKTMLEEPDVSSVFESGEYIEKIQRTHDGYDIYTNKNMVKVKVIHLPQEQPGPAKFQFEFARPHARILK